MIKFSPTSFLGGLAALIIASCTLFSAEPKSADLAAAELLREAQIAHGKGDSLLALRTLEKLIATAPQNAEAYYLRGRIHEEARRHSEAIASYSMVLRFDPKAAGVFQRRGCEHFRIGEFANALDDFDRFLELAPQRTAHHWQRGIAYYYAALFEKGKQQFELHQTVNANDVENAVWHLLCSARFEGFDKARKQLIPIQGDGRVPMKEIHDLFAGRGSTNEVYKAVQAGAPEPRELRGRKFYADLYVGLFFEAQGDAVRAREHIEKAAAASEEFDYMGDVARVHAAVLKRKQ